MFPGRFRRRKSDSLGPRPASVSSLRARVHTHVDAQHEAGHLTQAASAEQINRRTDTARVSERPRPGGNAGQSSRKFLPRKMCPSRGWFCFASPSHWQNKTTLWGCFDPAQTGPSESVRIVYKSRSLVFPRPGALVVCGIGVRVRVPFTRSPFARRAKNGPRGEFYR